MAYGMVTGGVTGDVECGETGHNHIKVMEVWPAEASEAGTDRWATMVATKMG